MSPLFRTRRSTRPTRTFSNRLYNKSARVRLMLQPLEERQVPAAFTVLDGGDTGGATQFRQLLALANSNAEADTITIDPSVSAVSLTGVALPAYNENFDLTIKGNGSGVTTITAPTGQRFLSITSAAGGTNIKIEGVTLNGGSVTGAGGAIAFTTQTLTLSDAIVTGNTSTAEGGGIYFTSGRLFMSSSTVSNNAAGIAAGDQGGGISAHSGGLMSITNSTISGNTAGEDGGGLYFFSGGTLILTGSSVTGNVAGQTSVGVGGGGVYAFGATGFITNSTFSNNLAAKSGGGGLIIRSSGAWTIANSQFTGNSAVTSGGAIESAGTITLTQSVFSGNSATTTGGAINTTNVATITLSSFSGNVASNNATTTVGGGAINSTSTVTVNNSTFSGNTATSVGGAISAAATLNVNNSTFNANVAGGSATVGSGGAVFVSSGTATFNNSTIYGNTAVGSATNGNAGGGIMRTGGTLVINSSIVAGNTATGSATSGFDVRSSATVNVAGNDNIIGTNDNSSITFTGTGINAGTNATPVDPLLDVLADNGGVTLADGNKIKTMALKAGSPAIDLGNNTANLTMDERGSQSLLVFFPRVIGTKADIGAYESSGLGSIPGAVFSSGDETLGGGSTVAFQFTVDYSDDGSIDTTTFDGNDVTVTGPNGYSSKASFVSAAGNKVTYAAVAPTGGWGGVNGATKFNIGNYTVTMNASQVGDGVNFVPAAALGTFKTNFGMNLVVDNKATDTDDGNYSAGNLTYREAINVANSNVATAVDSITFDTATMGSATLDIASTISISDSLNISGPSNVSRVTINRTGAANAQTLLTNQNTNLVPNALTVSNVNFTNFSAAAAGGVFSLGTANLNPAANASATFTNTDFTKNTSSTTGGGAIAVIGTTNLKVTNAVFLNNNASASAGAIHASGAYATITIDSSTFTTNTGASGGAVRLTASTGRLVINQSVFTGNTSSGTAGAVYASGIATLTGNVFSSNSAASNGGAIRFATTGLTITDSLFSGNRSNISTTSSGGGAVYGLSSSTASVNVSGSTFSGNTAGLGTTTFNSSGGAFFFGGTVGGGTGSFVIRQNTMTGNTAVGATTAAIGGGAIRWTSTGTLTIQNSTIADNAVSTSTVGTGGGISRTAGAVNLESNIVSGNTLPGAATNGFDVFGAASMTVNYTATSSSVGYTPLGDTGNQAGVAVGLNALANNGGFTLPGGFGTIQTRTPIAGSPVRDAGSNPASLTLDQRGATFNRVIGGQIDMGAVETSDPTPTAKAVANNVTISGGATFDVTVTFSDDLGIDTATIDVNDIVVKSAFGGATLNAKSFALSGPATSVTATYTFDAPDNVTTDTWDASDTDKYSVWIVGTVSDSDTPTINSVKSPNLLTTFTATLGAINMKVTALGDVDDGNYTAGNLTIREAVNFSNLNALNLDTISFDTTVFTGVTTTLSSTLNLTDPVEITGPGQSKLALSGNDLVQIFNVNLPGVGNTTISDMTLTKGRSATGAALQMTDDSVTLTNMTFSLNTATTSGGGVALTTGSLLVQSSTFLNNSATTSGGGIFGSSSVTISIKSSTFEGNTASTGGAIRYEDGSLTIDPSMFKNNRAGTGGALWINSGTSSTTIDQSYFTGNTATSGRGGAMYENVGGALAISNSTFEANTASSTGGAVQVWSGSATISNSTFAGNRATTGAAVHVNSSSVGQVLDIHNTTISGNTATAGAGGVHVTSTITLTYLNSTIAAANIGTTTADVLMATGTAISGTDNLIGVQDASWTLTGANQIGVASAPLDPLLNALANNGGFVLPDGSVIRTMSLKAGSPAYDTGNISKGPGTYDERGNPFNRVISGIADVGAFEAPVSPIPIAKVILAPNIPAATTVPYSFDVQYTDNDGNIDSTTFDNFDITVTGNGYAVPQATTKGTVLGAGNSYTVTYTVAAPAGGWGGVNIGSYAINMVNPQVGDDSGNFVPAGKIGSFKTAFAVALTVDLESDANDGNYSVNNLTLREALSLTNGNGGLDTINFNAGAFTGTPIVMASGLSITDEVQINGPGKALLTLSGNNLFQIFNIDVTGAGKSVTIKDMTLTKGRAAAGGAIVMLDDSVTISGVDFTLNTATSTGGGAISLSTGTLALSNNLFSKNTATGTGGALNITGAATVSISSTTFSQNTASNNGGALNIGTATVSVNAGNVFSANTSASNGGAIAYAGDGLTVTDSSLTGNRASTSGGAFAGTASASTITITNTTISGNVAVTRGGAWFSGTFFDPPVPPVVNISSSLIAGNSAQYGGGLAFYDAGTVAVSNSTLSGNTASGNGGAMYMYGYHAHSVSFKNSTVSNNTATGFGGGFSHRGSFTGYWTLNLTSTIVAGNYAGASSTALTSDIDTAVTPIGDNNLIGVEDIVIVGSGNLKGSVGSALDPQLNALANNGGLTFTMALKNSSPAINAGSNPDALSFDQRGPSFPREITAGNTDIGAYEAPIPLNPTAKLLSAPDIGSATVTTETITIQYSDNNAVDDSTFDSNDVTVTGPGYGGGQKATFSSKTGGGGSWTVTYTVPAPGGGWGGVNIGQYTISINGSQVADFDPLFVAAGSIGSFKTAFATTVTVDNSSDIDDGIYTPTNLTLREALSLTNGNLGFDTINFSLGGPATITMSALGSFKVSDSVSLSGPGLSSLTIDGNDSYQIFDIGAGAKTVEMSNMTVTKGKTAGTGAIMALDANTVTLTDMTLSNSTATSWGGAIALNDTTSVITLINSTVSGNSSGSTGGAISGYHTFGTYPTVQLFNSLISGNKGTNGGGIYFWDGGVLFAENSTLSGNVATGNGGAIDMWNYGASLWTIHNTTITGNSATGTGGGISGHGTPTVTLNSTIIAGNLNATANNSDVANATELTGDNNLVGILNPVVTLTGVGNLSGVDTAPLDAKLNPLANNGGKTFTHSLKIGSPAIDAGNLTGNPTLAFDQRGPGFPRVVNSTVDIGAFESAPFLDPQAVLITAPDILAGGFAPYSFDVKYTDDSAVDSTTFDLNDVTITGPGFGGGQLPTSIGPIVGGGAAYTVTYTIPAPSGGWGGVNIGAFTVSMNGTQVGDNSGAFVAAGSLGTFKTAFATTLTVDNSSDIDDGIYTATNLSLREAIKLTNNNVANDTINFSLPSGTTITLTSQLKMTDSTQIDGPGANKLAINANKTGRIFETAVAHTYKISNIELFGGSVTGNGGAILLGKGDTITLDNVWVHGNTATGIGGAVSPDTSESPSTASVTIQNSTVSGNSASTGGAVYFLRGMNLTILQSTIAQNTAGTGGAVGGFTTSSGLVTIHNSTISGNSASSGPAFRFTSAAYSVGILNLESSIVSGNLPLGTSAIYDYGTSSVNSKNSIIDRVTAGMVNDLGGSVTGTVGSPVDAKLTSLSNFGGAMPTFVLNAGSPALEAGSDPDAIGGGNDQRGAGFPRTIGVIDMGATEGVNSIPQATLTSAPNITTAQNGQTTYTFTVVYTDNDQILAGTIGTTNVTVSGPGFGSPAIPTSFTAGPSGASVTATYTITAPGGAFDFTDNGTYTINMLNPQVSDNADSGPTLYVPASSLGTFNVGIGVTYLVDEMSDVDDSITTAGFLSLREAIRLSNTSAGLADQINFAGNVTGTLTMTGAEYAVTDGVFINGPGASKLTIDAALGRRIFNETAAQDTTISGLTLINGSATTSGGAISTATGKLTLSGMVLSGNTAGVSDGGGVQVASGTLIVQDSTIRDNVADQQGGGINMGSGTNLQVVRSTISGNKAGDDGGGVYFFSGGSLLVDSSTLSGNTANVAGPGVGGGAVYFFGTATSFLVTNSTISGNVAANGGGGVVLPYFGGIAQFHNSTVTNNQSGTGGGGIAQTSGLGVVELSSTIVAGNTDTSATGPDIKLAAAANIGGNNNLVGVADTGNFTLTGVGNLPGTLATPLDAKLDVLANNGGPTRTHRLLSTSPAVDAGNNADTLSFDQRGTPYSRVVNSGISNNADIGAYEIQAPATVTSVVISDGTGVAVTHRSQVRQIIVTFSTAVDFSGSVASAFTVHRTGNSLLNGNPIGDVTLLATPATGPATTVTITFDNADTTFVESGGTIAQPLGSLKDGLYDFTINASKISTIDGALDGDGVGGFGGNYAVVGTTGNGYYRFFGDSNGDGLVNQTDYNAFRLAFLAGPSNIFDFDGNGGPFAVNQTDYNAFRLRFLSAP